MTKYQTNKLSDPDVRHAKPTDKLYRLRDGGGLSLDVLTSGAKVWRYAYRVNGKQKTFTIGTYPAISLKDARVLRDEAKQKVSKGIDPSQEKQLKKHVTTDTSFKAIAEDWFKHSAPEWSKTHTVRVRRYLEKDVYPVIGHREITEVEAPEMIVILRGIADRGALDVPKRVKQYMQQVYDYAVAFCDVRRNPARDINLKLVIPPRIKESFSAITDPAEAGELLRRIEGYDGSLQVKAALRLAPYFWLRPSELSGAEWSEFNFETNQWVLPAKRRKLKTHIKRADRPEDALVIPLCSQAVELLQNLCQYTGRGKYVFESIKKRGYPITPDSIRTAIRSLGYSKEQMTTHGFRSMARTMLEQLGYPEKMLELQLGHKWGTEVTRAYDRNEGIEQRTDIMQAWGDYLDSLRSGGDVVPFRQRA